MLLGKKTLQATYVERKELVEEMGMLLSLMGRLDQRITLMMEPFSTKGKEFPHLARSQSGLLTGQEAS